MSTDMTWVSPQQASPTSRFNINLRYYELENPSMYEERVRWDIGPMYERIFEDALARAEGTILPIEYERATRQYILTYLQRAVVTTVFTAMGAALLNDEGINVNLEHDLYNYVEMVTQRLDRALKRDDSAPRTLREKLTFWKHTK